jgi:hypothetical protein
MRSVAKLGKATIDLSIVSAELKKVLIPKLLGDRLSKRLANRSEYAPSFCASY